MRCPPTRPTKLAVLREIAALLDDPQLQATLTDEERERLARCVRPPDLAPVATTDVPIELAWPFIEKDGSRGRLIVLRGAARFNSFDVNDRLAFAAEVRALELPPGALVAGEALVVADIVKTMERDAPTDHRLRAARLDPRGRARRRHPPPRPASRSRAASPASS